MDSTKISKFCVSKIFLLIFGGCFRQLEYWLQKYFAMNQHLWFYISSCLNILCEIYDVEFFFFQKKRNKGLDGTLPHCQLKEEQEEQKEDQSAKKFDKSECGPKVSAIRLISWVEFWVFIRTQYKAVFLNGETWPERMWTLQIDCKRRTTISRLNLFKLTGRWKLFHPTCQLSWVSSKNEVGLLYLSKLKFQKHLGIYVLWNP